ncbi:hypothetical protein HJB90_08950 [Rhizobium sp. NLR10a]|uniref:hypothetical protein n=1 Tax=unclassified Rhizobium TaxID=2613769 RepID=UPI001C831341|nr:MULTISPECIES: hypothetical protein [unclassified Rhizobium]MBX5213972.1 hypothetical protein [Rhizobium sp. NLR9a]MBX5218879.1 hypothetical protein [Rhizobium sp. NLR8a]MBX5275361.1 hypothetical protein [Rhizobium sp. NLR13a]MBX5281148.1 hypothetical protein [Rhizobium sp. NLR10a]MBX5297544.1 hypothetical protein [Rhizobium sp. NLR15a]
MFLTFFILQMQFDVAHRRSSIPVIRLAICELVTRMRTELPSKRIIGGVADAELWGAQQYRKNSFDVTYIRGR